MPTALTSKPDDGRRDTLPQPPPRAGACPGPRHHEADNSRATKTGQLDELATALPPPGRPESLAWAPEAAEPLVDSFPRGRLARPRLCECRYIHPSSPPSARREPAPGPMDRPNTNKPRAH